MLEKDEMTPFFLSENMKNTNFHKKNVFTINTLFQSSEKRITIEVIHIILKTQYTILLTEINAEKNYL